MMVRTFAHPLAPRGRWSPLVLLLALLLVMTSLLPTARPQSAPPTPAAPPVAPVDASVQPLPATPAAPRYALLPELEGKPEVTAQRTATSATFDMGDGRYALLQSTQPLHYRDGAGAWEPINPAFAALPNGWANTTNTFSTALGQRNSSAKLGTGTVGIGWDADALLVTVADAQTHSAATPLDATQARPGTRSADGRTVRYTKSWSSAIADQWQSSPGSAEYTMRVPALPDTRGVNNPQHLDLRVKLHLQPGTTIQVGGRPASLPLETNQPLEFVGAKGETLLLQPPSTYEQADPQQQVAGSYVLAATNDISVIELRVRTPWAWLAAPERQFPVIIDPVFQMRQGTVVASPMYNFDYSKFLGYGAPNIGHFENGLYDLLVKFDMPHLPTGTTITSARVVVTPMGTNASSAVRAYAMKNSTWISSHNNNKAPDLSADPIPPDQVLHVSNGQPNAGAAWDVTDLVSKWVPFNGGFGQPQNNGLRFGLANPGCKFDLNSCAGFYMGLSNVWSEGDKGDLATFQEAFPDNPATTNGGVRLIVQYTGPQLNEGQTITAPALAQDPPYYHLDHEYRLPGPQGQGLPSRWQGVVVWGTGPRTAPLPNTFNDPPSETPLRGSFPLRLRAGDDISELTKLDPLSNDPRYVLLDGRSGAGAGKQFRARVGPVADPQTSAYNIQLLPEIGEINNGALQPTGVVKETPYTFVTSSTLALWNLRMPAGSNSRVDVILDGMNIVSPTNPDVGFQYGDARYNALYNKTSGFDAVLIKGGAAYASTETENTVRVPFARDGVSENGTVPTYAIDKVRLSSADVTPNAGDYYALALTYAGSAVDVFSTDAGECKKHGEFYECPLPKLLRLAFNVTVRVTSCPKGSFATSQGTCQIVRCPTLQLANNIYNRNVGGIGLWSEGGWTAQGIGQQSNNALFAPFIGAPGQTSPTVAVIEGDLSYSASNAIVGTNGRFKLVNCGALDNDPGPLLDDSNTFDVFSGNFLRDPAKTTLDAGALSLADTFLFKAWSDNDAPDLDNKALTIAPLAGTANGVATLTRAVQGDGNATKTMRFATQWGVNVGGWPTLTASASALPGNPAPPTVASLILDFGSTFSLDRTKAVDRGTPRQLKAVRASNAKVTQQPELGGASLPVQAVLLERGRGLPSDPDAVCPDGSCVDLRGPADGETKLDRAWTMPDVHVTGQAGTVLLSKPGVLQAFSTDHPQASPQAGAPPDFSFDAFGASVSVSQESCTEGGTPVTVVRGRTLITLPNIGTGSDPDQAITAEFKLCQSSLRRVAMSFSSPIGIPVGSSGLFVTGIRGSVDISPTETVITFSLDFQAAQGGNGGLFKGTGEVTISTQGLFAFQGDAKILGMVNAQGKLWAAWNPLDIGFEMRLSYGGWLSGGVRAHMWQGQGWQHRYSWLPDNNETHIAAEISAEIEIEEGAAFSWWFIDIPPSTITFGIEVAFGQFCTNSSCTKYEWGVKGKFSIVGYDVGLYFGFSHGFDFILGNDNHVLIDQYGGAQSAPIAVAGAPVTLPVRRAAPAVNGVSTETFDVSADTENLLVALGWQVGAPQLTLFDPQNNQITPGDTPAYTASITGTTSAEKNNLLLGVKLKQPKPGKWRAEIGNVQGQEHYKFIFFANKGAPGTASTAIGYGRFKHGTVVNTDATGSYTIEWEVPPGTPDTSTISLYYSVPGVKRYPSGDPLAGNNLDQSVPIVQHLPFKQGSYTWDTVYLASGSYVLHAVVDDGVNEFPTGTVSDPNDTCTPTANELPSVRAFDANRFPGTARFTDTVTLKINDVTPPATPTGLKVSPVANALLARWDVPKPTEKDVVAYLVEWGRPTSVAADGSVLALNAPNTQRITAVQTPTMRLGGLQNDQLYGARIAAVDASGNVSRYTLILTGKPSGTSDPLPEKPVLFKLTQVTATSASFSWSPKLPPNLPPPAAYRVSYAKVALVRENKQLDVTATNATISGLETGATYQFRVSAANKDGWHGPSTDPITVTMSSGVDGNGDSVPDDWASYYKVSGNGDPDSDGLDNATEYKLGTNPTLQDTDGDGFSDKEERDQQTNPLNSSSYGAQLTQPRLTLEDDRLTFRTKLPVTGETTPHYVSVSNTGSGAFDPVATASAPWIKAQALTRAGNISVRVSVDASVLQPGFYSGVVRVQQGLKGGAPVIGTPACIRVEAWVSPADTSLPAPTITSLSPARVTPGGPDFTLTVNGTGFIPGSTVQWNGQPRDTTFVNGTQLTIRVPAADIANAGSAQITVTTPAPSSATSNATTLIIRAGGSGTVYLPLILKDAH